MLKHWSVFALLAIHAAIAWAQFSPTRVSSGSQIFLPNDPKAQARFLDCVEPYYGRQDKSDLYNIGRHSLGLLSRLSSVPSSYRPIIVSALTEVKEKICAQNTAANVTTTLRRVQITDFHIREVVTGSSKRTAAEVAREVCLNVNAAALGLPEKPLIFSDLDGDQQKRVNSLCPT